MIYSFILNLYPFENEYVVFAGDVFCKCCKYRVEDILFFLLC